jgi:ABC-type dipeptide/oligopeptide/nickel transport system ATPase component
MKDGKVVEEGIAREIFDRPGSDYTKSLMKAAFAIEPVALRNAGGDVVKVGL